MSFKRLLAIASLLFIAHGAMAAENKPEEKPYLGIKRVGGQYVVSDIDKVREGLFRIEFTSETPTGRFDTLILESDHVHVAVKEGQSIRLSAEILGEKGKTAEVAQMVVFLPHRQGPVPVWLLSTKADNRELRSSTYLEMHVPLNDYIIM